MVYVLDFLGYREPNNTRWEKLRPNFERRDMLTCVSAYPLGHEYHTSDRMIIYSTSLDSLRCLRRCTLKPVFFTIV